MNDILILGAGLTGLSASYHSGHERCVILEKNNYLFGHVRSECIDGFTWDEGPHVSFTQNNYVKELFEKSAGADLLEYEVKVGNYFKGSWIDHPAQSNLYQVPEPLRSECVDSFINSRPGPHENVDPPENYAQWLEYSFGKVFANRFPFLYTRKYWTVEPEQLGIEWVGSRVFQPKIEEVLAGSLAPLGRETHYIKKVRYPSKGGYQQFAHSIAEGAMVELNSQVAKIDLDNREVTTASGKIYPYKTLINTLPLPIFIEACVQANDDIKHAARQLSCSKLLIVNITAPHPTRRPENWIYVYDEDMLSTRINFTERLSPKNAPEGSTGVQVEVYASKFRPFTKTPVQIGEQVLQEVIRMGLIDSTAQDQATVMVREVAWANVIFTSETKNILEGIWSYLKPWGLNREPGDTQPLTEWQSETGSNGFGELIMAGRFGQWKYFWSDDCVLRGKEIGGGI